MSKGPWRVTDTVKTGRKNIFCMATGEEHHIGTITASSVEYIERFENSVSLIRKAPELSCLLSKFINVMRNSNELDEEELRELAFEALQIIGAINEPFEEG